MSFDTNICIMSEQRLKVTLADIEAARRTMSGHVLRTPMLAAPPLSALTGAQVYVKYENLQVTNSFKERGACVKLAALEQSERRRGVIAMSAGNHAQAVAYHARRLGISGPLVPKSKAQNGTSGPGVGAISAPGTGPGVKAITSQPLGGAKAPVMGGTWGALNAGSPTSGSS